jgi:hypothetical protein
LAAHWSVRHGGSRGSRTLSGVAGQAGVASATVRRRFDGDVPRNIQGWHDHLAHPIAGSALAIQVPEAGILCGFGNR